MKLSILFSICFLGGTLGDICLVSTYDDVAEAVKNCDVVTLGDVVIPQLTTMKLNLRDGAKLIFDGHITHEPKDWTGNIIEITGNNVEISGTSKHLIDGLGPFYWKGANETEIIRPFLFSYKVTNAIFRDIHIKNCPNNCLIITESENVLLTDFLIDNKDGDSDVAGAKYAKNTDGFDVTGVNITVQNSIVYNQDDCVAVRGGHNMLFQNLYCRGSHGLSLSITQGDAYDIEFRDSHLDDAGTAMHIKTHNDGGEGSIKNVSYKNITFSGITNAAISIQENYPRGEAKANVPITNLTLKDVKGTNKGSKGTAISIICAEGGCADWHWEGVEITGSKLKNVCQNVPEGVPC